jgi:hypothetical protein
MTYVYQPTNPLQSFAQGFEVMQGMRNQRAEQEQMQAQQQRQQSLQAAIQNIRTNPTPQALADFYLQFPEMKDGMAQYQSTLNEADGTTLKGAAREAIIALRTGNDPAAVYERYAVAAENSRRPDLAKQFRDAAATAQASPEAADLTARLFFQGVDPDGYKTIYSDAMYDTPFLKELRAAGFEPGTKEWNDELARRREGDLGIVVPGVGLFLKDDVEAASAGRGGDVTPSIPEGAVKMLIQNPNLRSDFDKKYGKGASDRVLGGAGSNASGNFPRP